MSIDATIDAIAFKDHATLPNEKHVTQYLGNWPSHTKSWIREKRFPMLTIRYEDMSNKPTAIFGSVLEAIGAPVDQSRLEKAIRFSSIKEARKQEDKDGFVEKSRNADRFFGKGRAGGWKDVLTDEQIARVVAYHRPMMERFDYVPEGF